MPDVRASKTLRADAAETRSRRVALSYMGVLGAVFNLNKPVHVVHWHFVQMSVSNLIVIGLMLLVFALAIALPFPGAMRRRESRS